MVTEKKIWRNYHRENGERTIWVKKSRKLDKAQIKITEKGREEGKRAAEALAEALISHAETIEP